MKTTCIAALYTLEFANSSEAEIMRDPEIEEREKVRKDKAKRAVALAMRSRWDEAEAVNASILKDFPEDLEAYNRLGKALSELGRNRDAKEAFQRALEISPNNPIAQKNLQRLIRLGDEITSAGVRNRPNPHVFIEESGKAGLSTLVNLAAPDVILKLAPGHPMQLEAIDGGLSVSLPLGEYVGQVEPRLATRLTRLINGGNRYEVTVTSVGEEELTVIIREVYKHPSQSGAVSFPSRGSADYRVNLPSAQATYDVNEDGPDDAEPTVVKDWSDDDTEPGDDEAFTPVLHRIIDPRGAGNREEDEDF